MDSGEANITRESRLAVFEHVVEKKKPKRQKHFRANKFSDDSSPSESELVIDEDDADKPLNDVKKSSVRIKVSEEPLHLICGWNYCDETFECFNNFNEHLIYHVSSETDIGVSLQNSLDDLQCLWRDCPNPNIPSFAVLVRHLSYHGYLTKLKNIGDNVLRRNHLPDCKLSKDNALNITVTGYFCEWDNCFLNFNTIYDFLKHIAAHVNLNPSGKCSASINEWIPCGWSGCNMKFKTKYKLGEHVRVHTKEKIIACPTCSSLFSTKIRFCDHRNRQLKDDLRSYQCSQCLKLFPSEKLLSDHMRSHINQYKCTMCDMTCAKPSMLAKHYRFRHLNERWFECSHCGKKFVTKNNLITHLQTHDEKNVQKCDLCDFICKSKAGLDMHYSKVHDKIPSKYECHVCKQHFTRGGYLTKHLIKLHKFHWPSGHSRFRYRKDQDGICRLQTVRYESLEVTEEMIRSESMQPTTNMPALTYNVTYDNNQQGYKLTVVENSNVDNGNINVKSTSTSELRQEKEMTENKFIVTLDDVDMEGNLIQSRIIQEGDVLLDSKALPSSIVTVPADKNFTDGDLEESSSMCETKAANETQDSVPKSDCEGIHYFSKDIIMNYNEFKIETPKSES